MAKPPILSVKKLSIAFLANHSAKEVVHSVSFNLNENEILGIVGESGSGKSVTVMAIMQLLPARIAEITSGTILYNNTNLLRLKPKAMQGIRGKDIAMIFQEPMSALNPSVKCGIQVLEILKHHLKLSSAEAKAETLNLFEKVKLSSPSETFNAYPHEISGGQMQRVMIAMAIACKPKILIADEPTTALDVTVQKEIIALLKSLQRETGMSIIFISHDLNLVSEIADNILVMYRGELVEKGNVESVFKNPQHDYTKALIGSRPSLDERLKRLPTIDSILKKTFKPRVISKKDRTLHHKTLYAGSPLLEIIGLEKTYISNPGLFGSKRVKHAVAGVSFKIYEGETLGLVGESGCGKTTLGKAILQLDKATKGSIIYRGQDITHLNKKDLRSLRKEIQIIFQDPYSSLNPRILVGEAILEPIRAHRIFKSQEESRARVFELLKRVGLEASYYYRYPHELSGGQRQRIGIARAIALNPKLIICDESVSALDISVQAQVLNLLNELKEEFGFTYIFISHDLAVVKYMADQLLVMNAGKIEELGDADLIYAKPGKAYTQKLINAIPKGK